ncbi:hypothetical protein PMIN04_007789 [Paraphaeosphaeria minitans]
MYSPALREMECHQASLRMLDLGVNNTLLTVRKRPPVNQFELNGQLRAEQTNHLQTHKPTGRYTRKLCNGVLSTTFSIPREGLHSAVHTCTSRVASSPQLAVYAVNITFPELHGGVQVKQWLHCRAVPIPPRITPATEEGALFKMHEAS